MPLHRLYNLTTGTGNPSYLTNLTPGGAGIQVAGTSTNPMISAPRLEESEIEVLDITAPTNIGTSGTVPGAPALQGKLLVMSWADSIGGARWKQSTVQSQALARGQYGIVSSAGQANETGFATTSSTGNVSQGSKAIVMYDGPINAFVETQAAGISCAPGTPLVADGAGNLMPVISAPGAGTVLARSLGAVAASVSTPVLIPIFVGGF